MTETSETKHGTGKYAEQAGLFSPDVISRPIVDHLEIAKGLERRKLEPINKDGKMRPATLGDAERSLHRWWGGLSGQILSDADTDPRLLSDTTRLLATSADVDELLTALILTLPRRDTPAGETEDRLDIAERLAERIAELNPGARSHFAQHKVEKARENAMGIPTVRTNQERKREVLREMGEKLGYKPPSQRRSA